MYTFDSSEETALETYNGVCGAYDSLFDRLGVPYAKGRCTNIFANWNHLLANCGKLLRLFHLL